MKETDTFIDYLEDSLPQDGGRALYEFKRQTLDNMTSRANSVIHAGVEDDKVISDLIISEHPDIKGEYARFLKEYKRKRRAKFRKRFNLIGTPVLSLMLVAIFFIVGSATGRYDKAWLIIYGGLTVWCAYLIFLGAHALTRLKLLFYMPARIVLALDVVFVSVYVFIFSAVMGLVPWSRAWMFVILGLILATFVDFGYATYKRQRMASTMLLIYIIVDSPFVMLILSILCGVPFSSSWLVIPFAIIIDIIIIIGILISNRKYVYREEVSDGWEE